MAEREVILKSMVADNSPEYLMSLSRYVDDPELLRRFCLACAVIIRC